MKPFHEMTQVEMACELRALYRAQPKANWDRLAVGDVILHKFRGWRITRIPPKRGYVLAENLVTGKVERLVRSKYDSEDLLVLESDDTLARLRSVHRDELNKALAAGIAISPIVQYDYPEIFTPCPSEWDDRLREKARDVWMRINDLRNFHDHCDPPGWQFGVVDHLIEEAREDIAQRETHRAKCEAGVEISKPEAIPGIVDRVDAGISERREEMAMLLHLRRHLENTLPGPGDAATP